MIKRVLVAAALALSFIFTFTAPAAAASPMQNFAACRQGLSNFLGFQSWDACLTQKNGKPVITHINDIWLIVIPLIDDAIKASGYIAVGFIIWGGIQYSKSQGDASNLAAAKTTILNAVVGLILVMISVAMVEFISGLF